MRYTEDLVLKTVKLKLRLNNSRSHTRGECQSSVSKPRVLDSKAWIPNFCRACICPVKTPLKTTTISNRRHNSVMLNCLLCNQMLKCIVKFPLWSANYISNGSSVGSSYSQNTFICVKTIVTIISFHN